MRSQADGPSLRLYMEDALAEIIAFRLLVTTYRRSLPGRHKRERWNMTPQEEAEWLRRLP